MVCVRVLGAGPAGGAAALAALAEGAHVDIHEKSRLPRHKVCGEFLSPETMQVLDRLGVAGEFAASAPAKLTRMTLRFGDREKRARLPEPAFGLSRCALDQMLLEAAMQRGARIHRERSEPAGRTVIATGRHAVVPKGDRLFGFKAHFRGPVNDAVEMYFLHGQAYAGVSAVERGFTNVCGLAPEQELARCGFRIDEFLDQQPALRERLAPLERAWDWLTVGPLVFEHRLDMAADHYLAGDALSFIDPFTGSGIFSALLTGAMAGRAAARGDGVAEHIRACRSALLRPFVVTSFFRRALIDGWGRHAAPWLPARLLFRLTRPSL